MNRLLRSLSGLVVVLAIVLADAGSALAYLSTAGAGTASATVATITGPSTVTTSQTAANITVSWTAASLSSGPAVQGYTVTRSDGTTVCGSPTLMTTLSCTDSAVPAGTFAYTVKAVYHSWDASATSGSVTVLSAPTINSAKVSNRSSASFGFAGGGGSSYQYQLDSGT
jgi:hypothetical protein